MATLTKTLAAIAGILIVFAGVVFCRVQYNKAEDPIEATYWYIRYWGFVSGAYGIALFISAFIHNCRLGGREVHPKSPGNATFD